MNKTVKLIFTLIILNVLLVGCGTNEVGKEGKDTQVLKIMAVGSGADTYIDAYKNVAEKFSEENEYGVTLEFEFYETEQYKTKLATLMASNAVPDIFFTWELDYLRPFAEGGKVEDITSYLEKDLEWAESFSPGTLDLLAYNDKNYGIPTAKTFTIMFYNKKIFDLYDIKTPSTYEEFLEVCEKLKANDIVPMAMGGQDAWIPAQFVQHIAGGIDGVNYFNDIVSGRKKWNSEVNVLAAHEVKKMADLEYFPKGYLGMGNDEATTVFTSEKAGMYFMGSWDADKLQKSELGESVGAFEVPAMNPEYNHITVGSPDTSFAISKNCKNVDAAVDFLKYWTSAEVQEKLVYEEGRLPIINLELDEKKITPLLSEVLSISDTQIGLTPWWDRQFGAAEGVEFNNTTVSVLAGNDPQQAFDELQQFSEDNSKR